MSDRDTEFNKKIVSRFIECLIRHDLKALESLLHPEFVWNTAVTGDDDPNELRPMQSKEMKGKNLPHAKPRLNREETLNVFKTMFSGQYSESMQSVTANQSDAGAAPPKEQHRQMHIQILGLTAEADRVAMEAESEIRNPENGRLYNNFYHYLFRVRDGKLVLFKEYQDTLHMYDYLAD